VLLQSSLTTETCLAHPMQNTVDHGHEISIMVVAWRSGNAFHPINEVTLRPAGLVLRWVTACGQVNYLRTQPAAQVNSAFHPSGGIGKSSIGWG